MRRSKRYKNMEGLATDRDKLYSLDDAITLLKKTSTAKFDETIEVAFRLGVNPKYSDQMVRGSVVLPNGTGKSMKVAVITNDSKQAEDAKKAGAEEVGYDDLIQKIGGGWFDFDVLITTPASMRDLSKLGRVLGHKGLMPSPKAGTVTNNIAQAVEEVKKGKIEFKVDKTSNLHMNVGKASFDDAKISENITAAVKAIVNAKPVAAKGQYIKNCSISSTMGIGIKLDTKEAIFSGGAA